MLVSPALGKTTDGSQFTIAEWTAEPDPQWIAPLHKHHECDEAWYVLEGELQFHIDGETFLARGGDLVLAKQGSAHSYRNPGPQSARYLLIMTTQTKALIEAIHNLSDRSASALGRVFERFNSEYLGPL